MTGLFFYNFQRLSGGRCWSTCAYVYSSFATTKTVDALNQGADNWFGRLPGIQFQYLVRSWVTSTLIPSNKAVKSICVSPPSLSQVMPLQSSTVLVHSTEGKAHNFVTALSFEKARNYCNVNTLDTFSSMATCQPSLA